MDFDALINQVPVIIPDVLKLKSGFKRLFLLFPS